ncbi:coiled-coil domain-containing protein 73 isoform X2 [Rhinoderma darwinii]|uniref:coiled-coil domain-containing protein 73 isoform X2 n=1 Tax=Rhinoderma darwinii TaxID=43563 RepID=UPI003F673118
MDKDEMDIENPSYTLKGTSETLLPIQLFDFKAHLLEAAEELRMGRLAKIQYEEQINKILMERQELLWKYESLSNQEEIVEKKHNDSLAALKKQFQTKMCLIEEEKGRFQLVAETKERENISLREDIKASQKEVHELEQKLQLHILAKEDHIKQLSECKKCIGNVTQQFGMIKEVHEKLEQTVQTAIQNNKKVNIEINQKKNEIEHLKEELKKLSYEFLNYKVTYKQRADEENISLSEKEQHVKELKERLQTETEINKKLMEVNANMRERKQENLSALSNMQTLIQRHTQTIISLENQLSTLKEENKTLERDNELQRAKATENEEKFLALQRDHQQAFTEWKAQAEEHHNPVCDMENNTSENRTQSDPAANKTTSYVGSSIDVSLSLTSNEIQKTDGSKVEIVHKDANNLQNVYNVEDKGHLSEEQKDESSLTKNKASYIEESSDGKCTEEIPVDRACMNVEEYEERAAERITTMQTQAMAESIKILPDNNKPPTVCNDDASQQTDSSHHKSKDGTSEEVYTVIDKPDNDRGVLINEKCSIESQLFAQTTEHLLNEKATTRVLSMKGNRSICALGDGSNYHLPVLNRDTEISKNYCSHDQIQESKAEPIQPTNDNPHGVRVDFLFSEQTGNVDPKSVEFNDTAMDTTFNTNVNRIERAKKKSKCLGQETNFTTSQVPVGNESLQSFEYRKCNLQALQYAENADVLKVKVLHTDVIEKCPLDTGKNANAEETILCDLNVTSELQTDQTFHLVNVDAEKVCIQENDNVGAGCMSEVVSSRLSDGNSYAKLASIREEKSKPNGKSPINISNLVKSVFMPGSNSWDSLNVSPNDQTNHTLSTLSDQDVHSRAHHVPRKDHSEEWNAEQAFHDSSIPILATSSENAETRNGTYTEEIYKVRPYRSALLDSILVLAYKMHAKSALCEQGLRSDVVENPSPCPPITDSTRSSYLINLQNNANTEFTCSNRNDCEISSIQRQISAIERFLYNNRLNGSRKRKLEDTQQAEV